jgi:tetratricopeptide (TPR) repeat protein
MNMAKTYFIFLLCLAGIFTLQATPARILQIKGEVQIRRGLDETWSFAKTGADLEEMDSIMTGPESSVTLQLADGTLFRLASLAMIDIADLRRLSQQEMFLYIMSQKVEKLPTPPAGTKLEIGSVSVVHGENKATHAAAAAPSELAEKEFNGARSLQQQRFYTNAIVKYHKLRKLYNNLSECGAIQYELGYCFEQIQQPGQALDYYLDSRAILQNNPCQLADARERLAYIEAALLRLKSDASKKN